MNEEEQTSFSEKNIGDIASLDAAKVALRWTMERHHSLEEENKKLHEDIEKLKETSHESDARLDTLRKTLEGRAKKLEEEELFYTKLSGTLKLLCEGKIDVQTLIEKQLELEALQKRLSEEHQKRLLDLEHMQQQVTDRWHQRLLELESTYAQRLNRARQNFEALRQSQESSNVNHLKTLEGFYKEKEKRLEETKTRLQNEWQQKQLAMEAEFAQKHASLEKEFESLKTRLMQEHRENSEMLRREHAQREAGLKQAWEADMVRLNNHAAQLESKMLDSLKENESLKEAGAQSKNEAQKAFLNKVAAYEAQYKEKMAKVEERQGRLDSRAKELEAQYLERQQTMQHAYGELRNEFDEKIKTLEAAALQKEKETAQKYENEKKLLDNELQAALQSANDLTGQLHQLEEEALQRALRKDAQWTKTLQELRSEMEKIRQDFMRQLAAKDEQRAKLELDLEHNRESLAQTILQMKQEFAGQINKEREIWTGNGSAKEEEQGQKTAALQKAHQETKIQMLQAFEQERLKTQQEFKERLRAIETDHQNDKERWFTEIKKLKDHAGGLRQENERLTEALGAQQTQYREEMFKRSRAIEESYKKRLDEVEGKALALTEGLKAREQGLELERERLYEDLDKRRAELDELEHVLMKRLEDLEGNKQDLERQWRHREEELRQRDQRWHQHRSRLETLYTEKSAQIEDLKEELIKEIQVYKNGKET